MTNYKNEESEMAQFIIDTMPDNISKIIVDVGANNHAEFSDYFLKNTTIDWQLFLIEPNPECVKNLTLKYPISTIIQKACSNKTQIQKLYLGKDSSEVSTLNTNSDPWFDMVRSENVLDVQCDTLTNILTESNCPNEFGILKIDCESYDPFVLKGLDFNKFQPMYIVTEEYYWEPENLQLKYNILDDAGYILLGFVGYNSVWRKKTNEIRYPNLILKENFKIHNKLHPPNIGDLSYISKVSKNL